MRSKGCAVLLPGLAITTAASCAPDVVAFGYYGAPEDAGAEVQSSAPRASEAAAATPVPPSPAQPAAVVDAQVPAGEVSDREASDGEASASPAMAMACDLTGRWLATEREVANGLGAQEATHTWYYLEIGQTDSQATVTKGLDCGGEIRPISAVGANSDYPKLWPALLTPSRARLGRRVALLHSRLSTGSRSQS